MTFAISQRPRHWDGVVGQDRAITMLKAFLAEGRFRLLGFTLEGPTGVGKTTTAYILAQALMCVGGNPLGCGTCPSCLLFQQAPERHPDFTMIDGASNSGVEDSRRIVVAATDLPIVGRNRIVVLDEAHRLSSDAWDIYLAPLESLSARTIYIFCTTVPAKIPKTIRGRCCRAPFARVATETLANHLVCLADRQGLDYETDGMRQIARAAKGHVRDAVNLLSKMTSLGKITKAMVTMAADLSATDLALNVLLHLVNNQFKEACLILENLGLSYSAGKAIEEVFSAYARSVFHDVEATEEESARYRILNGYFTDAAAMTTILLKWSATDRIPADALPLFAHELMQQVTKPEAKNPKPSAEPQAQARSRQATAPGAATPTSRPTLNPRELAKATGGNLA